MIALRWHVLRLPLLLSLLWCLLLFALFQWTVQREDENATELAQIQTRTLFSSIVNTRGWNADRGGVLGPPNSPNCQPNPVASRRSAHAPHRGRAAACQVQSSLYDPANRGTLPVQDDELPYLRLVPQTPAKPPRPMGNECPARLRCGKDRAVSACSGTEGCVLPLYGTAAGGGKLPAMPSEKQNRGRARRHQRIHFRLSHPCLG